MTPSSQEIVRSYRNLYRHALHAVQYSVPARYTFRDLLRRAYRAKPATDFDAQRINNTISFIECAAKGKGLEHKILKNLLHVWWWAAKTRRKQKDKVTPHAITHAITKAQESQSTIEHFEITLKMLNESMTMCFPTELSPKET